MKVLLTLLPFVSPSFINYSFQGRGQVDEVHRLIHRVLGQSLQHVLTLELDETLSGFEISDVEAGMIRIRGGAGPDIAYGVGVYFREFYLMSFSWERSGGHRIQYVGGSLIPVGSPIKRQRNAPISYFNNVVTFSYSFVWYGWSEWEYFLDWAALNGFNLMIAFTGQEEIYRKTFNSFGVSDEDFSSWCNNVAHLAWSRGQNLHGCNGGLNVNVMKQQWALQKQIVERMRNLGIVPVFPVFQGNMPTQMRKLFPYANISNTGVAWLDGNDPLFQTIQAKYMKTLIEDWGTDNWYEADGYFDHSPEPWKDSSPPPDSKNSQCRYNVAASFNKNGQGESRSKAVYESMAAVDFRAMWLYQGWIWRGWGEDKLEYMKSFIDGPPRGSFVLLDMFDEVDSEWDKFQHFSYFGAPFIWSVLHNFGGNTGLWGDLGLLNRAPFEAFKYGAIGTGAAPEGIDQNPIYYQLVADVNWMISPLESIEDYSVQYSNERYGIRHSGFQRAWRLLTRSVYGGNNSNIARSREWLSEKNSDGLTSLPMHGGTMNTPTELWFDLGMVLEAWTLLVHGARTVFNAETIPRTLNYDIGREVLAKHSNILFEKTLQNATLYGPLFLDFILEADGLLCSESSFLLSRWEDMAGALANSVDASLEKSFRQQARMQVTTWGPQSWRSKNLDSTNNDYGNKQWGGTVGGLYYLRHACFVLHFDDFENCSVKAVSTWISELSPSCELSVPFSSVEISEVLLSKYFERTIIQEQTIF